MFLGNRCSLRRRALAASSSRVRAGEFVSSDTRRRADEAATSSMAARKAASLAFEGLLNPVIFRTNCREAARISSSVTGGLKLKSGLMFRHMGTSCRGIAVTRERSPSVVESQQRNRFAKYELFR